MSRQIKIEKSHPPLVPHWMVTFSDMRVVLLCFFVLLAGFSGTGKDASEGPGALCGYAGMSPTSHGDKDSLVEHPTTAGGHSQWSGYENPSEYDPLTQVYQGLDVRVRASVLSNALQYKLTDKGFEIEVLCGTLFEDSSAAEITPDGKRILDVISGACRNLPHQVRVQAYADDLFVPDESCATDEALALRRAAVVCAYLQDKAHLRMEQLSIATQVSPAPLDRKSQVTITVLPISRKNAP